jgi:arsenate reductase-like glutaredoxin family protein
LAATILKDKYTPNELSIILSAIEFHEAEMINQEEEFKKITNKYNLLEQDLPIAKTICKILKDADALERTRFINDSRVNPQFLNFDYSKKLIKFASEVQDTYALEDLKQYNCDEEISVLLQKFTPQEILRTIRHNKNNMILIDAQKFLNGWAKQERIEISDIYKAQK